MTRPLLRASALCLAALTALAGAAAAAAPEGRAAPDPRFQVTGSAVILHHNQAAAQQRAIKNAFRSAVVEAARQSVGEQDLSRYRAELENTLLRLSAEFIRSYRVLRREVNPEERSVKVRLEVVVDLPAVDEALRSLKLAHARKQEVRILVLAEERILGEQPAPSFSALSSSGPGAAESRLVELLRQAGYITTNPRAQREPARPGQIGSAIGGDIDAARLLGGLCGCRMVITLRAVAERERSGAFVGLVNARVIRVEDGAVIAIRSQQVRQRSRNIAQGNEIALSTAAARLANVLLPEIRKAFPPPARTAREGKR